MTLYYYNVNAIVILCDGQGCAVVGGMAMEKQERLLSQRPSIVVATPGRLWSLMSEVCLHIV